VLDVWNREQRPTEHEVAEERALAGRAPPAEAERAPDDREAGRSPDDREAERSPDDREAEADRGPRDPGHYVTYPGEGR
jgi:hypothetical protein